MNGKEIVLTNEMLLEKARVLAGVSNRINIVSRLFEVLESLRLAGDTFNLNHQIGNGLLTEIGDSLDEISETIHQVSNDICPDSEVAIDEKN